MRVIIAGGRDFADYEAVKAAVLASCFEITEVVSGACRMHYSDTGTRKYASGADGLGERWAVENGVPFTRFYAGAYGYWPECGPNRNEAMATYADALIAMPGGRGTADMIRRAKAHDLRIFPVPA